MSNSLCSDSTMCVAEVPGESNQFKCVRCSKQIARFVVDDLSFDESTFHSLFASNELKVKKITEQDDDYLIDDMSDYVCGVENSTLRLNIDYSIGAVNYNRTRQLGKLPVRNDMLCNRLYSEMAPISFDLKDLLLFCDCLEPVRIFRKPLHLIILFCFLLLLAFIVFILIHKFSKRNRSIVYYYIF